jgi:uncharacterized HAD superfamily protein
LWCSLADDFHEVWGGSRDDANVKMMAFFESSWFLGDDGAGLPIVAGAREVLHKYAHAIDFHIVTSRQHFLEDATRAWIDRHYPGLFISILFGNHYASSGVKRSKPDMCKQLGAQLLIDDSLRYATQCSEAGIRTALFGTHAWNTVSSSNSSSDTSSSNTSSSDTGSNSDCSTTAAAAALPENVVRVENWAEVEPLLQDVIASSAAAAAAAAGSAAEENNDAEQRVG